MNVLLAFVAMFFVMFCFVGFLVWWGRKYDSLEGHRFSNPLNETFEGYEDDEDDEDDEDEGGDGFDGEGPWPEDDDYWDDEDDEDDEGGEDDGESGEDEGDDEDEEDDEDDEEEKLIGEGLLMEGVFGDKREVGTPVLREGFSFLFSNAESDEEEEQS